MHSLQPPSVERGSILLDEFPDLNNINDAATALSIIITMYSLEPGIPLNPRLENTKEGVALLKREPNLHNLLKEAHATKCYDSVRMFPSIRKPDCLRPESSEKFLSGIKPLIAKFLDDASPVVHWRAQPTSSDGVVAAHIDSLKLLGRELPLVILQDLGGFVDDPALSSRVHKLFTRGKKTVLVNASGSGKTRLTFEGLCLNWGFYFTMKNSLTRDEGSNDLAMAAEDLGLSLKDPTVSPTFLKSNHTWAQRHLSQALLARLLVFRAFLEHSRECGLTPEHKKKWLLLQLHPSLGSTADIFKTLTIYLGEHDPQVTIPEELVQIRRLLEPDSHLFFVLDEAQTAADMFPTAFDLQQGTYPFLRKIVDSWDSYFTDDSISWVVAGTRIPKHLFDTSQYADKVCWTSDTGSFDDQMLHERYMRQFLPPSLLDTDSGKAFLQRAWTWTRGRHRYTASLLTDLIVWNFQQPHTVLNMYIEKSTHFKPTDGHAWTKIESRKTPVRPSNLQYLQFYTHDFTSLDHPGAGSTLRSVIYHYTVADRSPAVIANDMKEVTEDLGRFLDGNLEEVAFNEPIALVGCASFMTELPSDSYFRRYTFVENCLVTLQRKPPPSAKAYAACLAFYFHHALASELRLCDVFTFTSPAPAWATQSVELVEPASNQDYRSLATSATRLDEVVTWLEHSTGDRTPFCISAAAASSPDLLFVLKLRNGVRMNVAMRLSIGDSDGGELLADLEEEKMFCGSENDADFGSHQRAIELLNSFEDDVQGTPSKKKKVDKGKKKEDTAPPRVLYAVAAFNKQIDLDALLLPRGRLSSAQAALSLEMFNKVIAQLRPRTFVESVASNVLKRKRDDVEIDSNEGGKEDGEGRGRERKRHHTAPPERGDDTDAEMTSPGHKYHTRSQDRPGKKGSPVQRSLQEGRYKGRLLAAK